MKTSGLAFTAYTEDGWRKHVADRVRRAVKGRGRMGKDVDTEDLEELLASLEEREGAEDDEAVERPGFTPPLDPSENPWPEAFDEELESLRSEMSPEAHDRLRRARAADRRRTARDAPPDYPGKPEAGGSMVPNPSTVDRPGFGQPADPAAKDKRPGFRRFGQDAAPASTSFDRRFSFTQRATSPERSRTMPGVKMTAT